MVKMVHCFIIFLALIQVSQAKCNGRFVNPITDVCWSCIFPITIGGVRISANGEDTPNRGPIVCQCPAPPPVMVRYGVTLSLWEPVRLVDVTREPHCLVAMGGIKLAKEKTEGRGAVDNGRTTRTRSSFYQVHVYRYPLLYWLELLLDFLCMETGEVDIAYYSELEPYWNDDESAFIFNPEAILFANPIAQAACAADCVAASAGFPLDPLFWCAGCQGSMYPFTGTVSAHVGGVQASLLLVERVIALMHREGRLYGTVGSLGLCQTFPMPIIQKSQYKTQMVYPIPSTASRQCHPFGRSEQIWATGKEFPYQGEDFAYLIWRKRSCCLL